MMKTRTKVIALALTAVLMSVVASALIVNANKPLYCEKYLDLYIAGAGEPYLKGWISGDINGYFVVFHSDPIDEKVGPQVTHYRETWAIYTDDSMEIELMGGSNTGFGNAIKGRWHAQGQVDRVNEDYAYLLGRKWNGRGIFTESPEVGAIIRLVDTRFIMH